MKEHPAGHPIFKRYYNICVGQQQDIMNILALFGSTDGIPLDHYVENSDYS